MITKGKSPTPIFRRVKTQPNSRFNIVHSSTGKRGDKLLPITLKLNTFSNKINVPTLACSLNVPTTLPVHVHSMETSEIVWEYS